MTQPIIQPSLDDHYLPHVAEARGRIRRDRWLSELIAGHSGAEALCFMIHYSALAMRVAKRVDDWIARAGLACAQAGRVGLGADISTRSGESAEHGQLLLGDLCACAEAWEQATDRRLDLEPLLAQPPPASLLRHLELRESIVTGPEPWAWLGVELELAVLFDTLGPALMGLCPGGHRFLEARVELARAHLDADVSHLGALLEREPDLGWPIARAGAEALDSYLDLLADCVALGERLHRRSEQRELEADFLEHLEERIPA